MRSGESPRLGYRPALDGLRAIAVCLVVLSHATSSVPGGGPAGVALFFVLSGFLITALLLEERDSTGIAVGAFFGRRALRLVPALFVLLVTVTVMALVAGVDDRHDIWTSALLGGTYTADLHIFVFNGVLAAPLAHLWTLSIEEKFYVVWPFALTALRRVSDRVLLAGLVVAVATLEAARWALVVAVPSIAADPLSWVEALLIGSALGFAFRRRGLPDVGWAALAVGVALLLAVSVLAAGDWYDPAVIATPLLFGAVVTLLATVDGPSEWTRILSLPPMRWIGRRSYSLYLWHVPIVVAAGRIWGTGWLVMSGAVAGSVLAAAMSYRFVEQPFLRRKRGLERTSSGSAVATTLPDP